MENTISQSIPTGWSSFQRVLVDKAEKVRCLRALPLMALLGIGLFFPLLFETASIVKDTTLQLAVQQEVVSRLSLAAFAVITPLLCDQVFDAAVTGLSDELAERLVIIASIFASFLGQYLATTSRLSSSATLFVCFYCFQIWMWTSASFIALKRTVPAIYTMPRIAAILTTLYLVLLLSLIHLLVGGTILPYIFMTLLFSIALLSSILFTSWAVYGYQLWRASEMRFLLWFHSLDENLHNSVGITLPLVAGAGSYVSFIIGFNGPFVGFVDYSFAFWCGYTSLAILHMLFTTLLLSRITKSSYHRASDELLLKRTFVRYVSHEIRTPLNIVVMGLDLVAAQLESGVPPAVTLSTVAELRTACAVGVDILNDLLTYEKLESGIMVAEKTLQDPVQFFHVSIQPFHLMARQGNIDFVFNCDITERAFQVHIDETKVSQVIRNLLSNAFKFTPQGGTVTVNAKYKGFRIELEVMDSGAGISQENQAKLFNSVIQFHAKAQQGGGGSGLGLWISKKIVELHGGTIGVQSEGEGRGSRFYFDLPVSLAASCGLAPGISSRASNRIAPYMLPPEVVLEETETNFIPLRVLIVDDSAMNRKIMRARFEKDGHSVVEADDGDTAVNIVRETILEGSGAALIDLVTMDNLMPRMPGVEATSVIRAMGYRGVVIGITGNALQEDIAEFLRHGADAVLPKPAEFKLIMTTFQSLSSELRPHDHYTLKS